MSVSQQSQGSDKWDISIRVDQEWGVADTNHQTILEIPHILPRVVRLLNGRRKMARVTRQVGFVSPPQKKTQTDPLAVFVAPS